MSSANARFSSSSPSTRSMKDFNRSPAMPPTSGMESPPRFVAFTRPYRSPCIDARQRAPGATFASPRSVLMAAAGNRFLVVLLVLCFPLFIRHAINHLARRRIGDRQAALLCRLAIPAREAIAAEAGEVHQVEVLHVGAFAQMLHQAAESRRLKLGLRLLIHSVSP